jgi:hypothetical protein
MEHETDNIASNLNNLFGSDLFKENNFIKIYNLLGITNIESPAAPPEPEPPTPLADAPAPAPAAPPAPTPAPEPAPAPPPAPAPEPAPAPAPPPLADAPAEIDNILGKFNYNNNKLLYNNAEITIFDDNTNLAEIIKLTETVFSAKNEDFKTKILNSIIIGDIVTDLKDTDIIVDPAGLDFMKGNYKLNDASGLSYALYNYIKGTGDFLSRQNVKTHFNNFTTEKKLFDKSFKNAFYYEYDITNYKPINDKYNYNPQVVINTTIIKLKLIHAIGPNYSSIKLTDIKDEYKKFMVLYNDIFSVYTENITNDKKLRLPLHSTGLFSGKKKGYQDNIIYILICLALAYLYIYCKINEGNEGNDSKVNIYYIGLSNDINNFKKILTHIIDLIK